MKNRFFRIDPRELLFDITCVVCFSLFYGLFLPEKGGVVGRMQPGFIVLIQFAAYLVLPWYLGTLYNKAEADPGPAVFLWLFRGFFVVAWLTCLFFLIVFSSFNLQAVLKTGIEFMAFILYCILGALAGIITGAMVMDPKSGTGEMRDGIIRPARLVAGALGLWAAFVYGLGVHRASPWLALVLLFVGVALPVMAAIRINTLLTKRAKKNPAPRLWLQRCGRILAPVAVALVVCGWQRLSVEGGFHGLGIRFDKGSLFVLIASGVLPFRLLLAFSPPFRPLNLALGVLVLFLNHTSLAEFMGP